MKRVFISTLLIVLSIPAFSYAQYTVYTWGYQDIMVSMLEAVKYFMGTKSFGDMFKIAMLLSVLTIFLSLISDKGFSPVLIFQKVILVIALQTFLISPFSQMDLDIVDVSGNGALTPNGVAERVEKVPGVVGYPLYILSNLEYGVRDAFRSSLNIGGLRTGAQYLDGMSIITALNLYQSTTNVRINNPDFTKSYQSFVENCVLPDMVSGYLDVRAVATSTNLWQLFGQDPHRARIGSFYMDYSQDWGPDGQILTCDKLYQAIDAQFATVSTEAANQLKAGLGLSAGINLDQMIGAINTAIVGFQQNQSNVLTNSMAINTFNDSYENIANGMGMDTTGLAYSMAKAQETARMNASMQGIMAKKYMPIAKGYLTVIFVAVIPLVIIIALVTSNFKKPFAMIFGLLLALALWNVGDQLLDFIIIVRTKALFALSGMSGYNMESQPFINSIITDTLNLSLGMYWMIPTLAFSIATLSGFGAASMMGSIAGTATAGVSGAAAEAASGSMSMGNIRMSNVNMNKYDAAQTMNAGTSTKMSMDYQQTASNQSSVSTGTRNIHDDADSIKHEGSTFMRNQDGELLRMTGTYEQTGGGWKFSGNVQNLSTGETYTGNMSGMAKDMNSMQQGLNVDDVSMTGKERANLGDVKGENVAFIQGTVVDSNLSASDVTHKDKITTSNNIDQNNNIKEAKTVEDYSKLKDTSDVTKNNTINENNNIDQNNNIKEAKTVEDYSKLKDTSDVTKNNTINENKHVEDNTTSISTGTQYKGVAQAAMGKTEDFEKMMNRFADMKQAVLNGDMSAKEFQAEVRNFSGAYAQEMGQFLTKQESEGWGTDVKASVGADGQVRVDSKDQVAGKVASAVTGVSYSGNVHAGIELGISRDDRTQSAQNLIAKEMYDTIMQSGNVNDMVNNASNLANKHADTNLSSIDMAMNEIPKAVDGLKEKAGNFSEQHLDRILK